MGLAGGEAKTKSWDEGYLPFDSMGHEEGDLDQGSRVASRSWTSAGGCSERYYNKLPLNSKLTSGTAQLGSTSRVYPGGYGPSEDGSRRGTGLA